MLAFHQVAHISALARTTGFDVVWVVKDLILPDRAKQGWSVPEVKDASVVVDPDLSKTAELIQERQDESLHIFTGIHQEPLAKRAFELCVRGKARIALLNEPPIPGSALRNFAIRPYHVLHTLKYGSRINFILAIGGMSVEFYKSIGYPEEKVFPYGYFVETTPPSYSPSDGPFALSYVGQLIERKGVDLLLSALSKLTDLDWQLKIMGAGPDETALKAMTSSLSIVDKVNFRPPGPNFEALQLISSSDLFVLPSRHDGWGTVVNEALLCGVPVICSDRCGAADLLRDDWRGATFRSGSADDLAAKLRSYIERGKRTKSAAARIQEWCGRITGESAAAYLASVISAAQSRQPRDSAVPVAPWLKPATTLSSEEVALDSKPKV